MISRRKCLTGLIAAPAVLRLGLWMPVRPLPLPINFQIYGPIGTEWLRAQLEKEMLRLLSTNDPLPYSENGFPRVSSAFFKAVDTIGVPGTHSRLIE